MNGWIEMNGYLAGFFGSKNNVFFLAWLRFPLNRRLEKHNLLCVHVSSLILKHVRGPLRLPCLHLNLSK